MKHITEIIPVDEKDENTLLLTPGDSDGFHIEEIEGKGKVYVYYSEIDRLMECLQRMVE